MSSTKLSRRFFHAAVLGALLMLAGWSQPAAAGGAVPFSAEAFKAAQAAGSPISARIIADSVGLTVTIAGKGPYPLEYVAPDRFRLGSSRFAFLRDQGRVTRVFADLSSLALVLYRHP